MRVQQLDLVHKHSKQKKSLIVIYSKTMELLSSSLTALSSISIQLPLYVALSPLCMISSSLYASVLDIQINDQAILLVVSLGFVWAASAKVGVRLVQTRSCKCIFFYQFLALITVVSFILIGVTYSILMRANPQEEVIAKVCATVLTVYAAEKMKMRKSSHADITCRICFGDTNDSDCMTLGCGHSFHEKCLWDWIYIKKVCPTCLRSLN